MITLYGIPNCDTVKKARTWLTDHGVDYTFHGFKKQGVPEAQLDHWLATVGWETLVNRKGTMWRGLDEATKASVVDAASARAVVLGAPSVVKRPVVVWADGTVTVGFKPEAFAERLACQNNPAEGGPMNWLILFVAGLFEVAWAIGLKYTDGFTRLWPSVGTVLAMVASVVLLGIAMKTLPVGTAYAVWVGIGAVGTAILGMALLGDAANAGRIVSLALIVAGVVGLKLATPA